MVVASISLFEFWFLWVVVFCAREVSLDVLWSILGCFGWFLFGSLFSFGSRKGPLGSLWGSLGGVGVSLCGRVAFCVPPGVGSGKIREILGDILGPFWEDFL